jgi:hypothetical protein
MFATPILLIIFNRPEPTFRVFERIRQIRPKYLFIAADGPRPDRAGEEAACVRARSILQQVDWPCEVKTLFREQNIGCGKGVSGAISWFFEHTGQGIILEDDCLPDPGFFSYCEDMLAYYHDNEKVMHIGGTNSQFGRKRNPYSYYYSKYPHIWGWATWSRAWKHFRYDLSLTDTAQTCREIFQQYVFSPEERSYWQHMFDVMKTGGLDTWDVQWTYACWAHQGVTIVPNVNLISNIGFDADATHTKSTTSKLAQVPTRPIGKLSHPPEIRIDTEADDWTFRYYNLARPTSYERLRGWAGRLLPRSVKDMIRRK